MHGLYSMTLYDLKLLEYGVCVISCLDLDSAM